MLIHFAPFKKQTGAVLLAFMLVLIVASAFYLTKKLNTNLLKTQHSVETGIAMKAAKNALIGYAISYPDKINADEGPGYLPCPDLNNNGSAGGSCSLTGATSIGRFPYKTLEAEELRDGHGERLWYVVSDNFRNNPKMIPLNSETAGNSSGDMTVGGYTNIAAVIFSAGVPENNQNRISANKNDYTHYIEATFTDSDGDAVIDSITTADTDRYILLTKDELMQAVEKRVLGEVSQMLITSYNNNGAYPWLTPFADPKADSRILHGTHTGSDNATSLTDSRTDFKAWGVKKGDIVRNITDGSLSVVTVDNNSTVLTVTGIHLGTDNDFDTGDEYYIVPRDLGKKLDEKADVSSSGLTLVDGNQEFVKLDVVPGDVIDNITDGSSGIVETVVADTITVSYLTGGAFNDNDEYQVRSYAGEATNGSGGLLLEDNHKDFTVMGVSAGDVIVNLKDGSMGRVASLKSQTEIIADSMNFGWKNDFVDNDNYILPQYYGVEGTREGLISFHRVGEFFPSAFDVDWNIPELIGTTPNAIVSLNTPGTHTDYINNLKQLVQTSSGTSGTITVGIDEGTCVWTMPEIVECMGSHTSYDPVQGQLTSGSNTATITDSTKDFVTLGVNPGDIVQNYDDETFVASGTATAGSNGVTLVDSATDFSVIDPVGLYNYLFRNTSYPGPNKSQGILAKIDTPNTLKIDNYSGWDVDPVAFNPGDNWSAYTPAKTVVSAVTSATTLTTNPLIASLVDFDAQEFYRVKSATGKLTGTATAGSSGTTLEDIGQNFSPTGEDIQVGDVVRNVTDGSWGEITAVTQRTITATLYDDNNDTAITTTTFDPGDSYEVYYAYMNSRRYEFRVRFNGTAVTNVVNESRKRDVCLGYMACTGGATNVSLPFYNLGSSGTATANDPFKLKDDPGPGIPKFKDLRIYPGHVVVNTTDGSNGIITARLSDKEVSVDELNDGAENDFDTGESYYITAPVVTIKDYDASENELSSAAVSIPSGGAQGSIKVSNIDYYLTEAAGEIPKWFLKNKWHQLVYIAYSAGDSPNGGAVCTVGTDCLTLTGGGTPDNNKRALVISAGDETNTNLNTSCTLINPADDSVTTVQDRTTGLMNAYYEGETCSEGDNKYGVLDKPPAFTIDNLDITGKFNDQIRVLDTSP